MFRKTMTVLLVVQCMYTFPSIAQTKTAFTIGGNYWHAQRGFSGEYWGDVKSKAGDMVGPYVNLRIGKWLLGSSMFFGAFSESSEHNPYYNLDSKRSDLNFSLGYSIISNLNVFVAAKNLSFNGKDDDYSYYDTNLGTNIWHAERELENKGTMYGGGASGVFRFSRSPLFVFWSAAYLTGNIKTSDKVYVENQVIDFWGGDFKADNELTALSGGIGIQTNAGISVLVGYREDLLKFNISESGTDWGGKETLKGITVTLAYTLQ